MEENQVKEIVRRNKGQKVELDDFSDRNLNGIYEVVEEEYVEIDSVVERLAKAALYAGNARKKEVTIEGETGDQHQLFVTQTGQGEFIDD